MNSGETERLSTHTTETYKYGRMGKVCLSFFAAKPTGQVCTDGVVGLPSGEACCPVACGTCGGSGCANRGSGLDADGEGFIIL